MALRIRERAPLRLHATIETPSGRSYRWAGDERNPENALGAGTFSSTAPGGFEQGSASLARKILHDFPDLEEFSTVTFRGAGGEVAGQYRLEGSPRQWGQQSGVQPQLNGWQNHLQDDNSAREIYLDIDQSGYQPTSVARKLALLATWGLVDPSNTPDATTGQPSVVTEFTNPFGQQQICEAWYDANDVPIGKFYYAWKAGSTVPLNSVIWVWEIQLADDDLASAVDSTSNLNSGPASGTGVISATTGTRKFVQIVFEVLGANASSGQNFPVYWTFTGVVGKHGLPIQGTLGATGGIGLLASDIIGHAVGRWAPKLAFTTGPGGTIQPSTFSLSHLAFPDPTTASAILQAAAAFELLDWFVWEGPTFWLNEQGAYSRARHWRARVGPAQLQDTGPQVSRIYNGAIVTFTDVSGISRSVGPPGSGCNIEDASLLDPDPLNPANQLGIPRYGPNPPINIGTGTADMAIRTGQGFLQEQKQFDTSGNATLTGWVEDDRGVLWPYWKVRGGDTVSFVDASDTSPRRVVRSEAADATKTASVSLDAPPEAMTQYLARIGDRNAQAGF